MTRLERIQRFLNVYRPGAIVEDDARWLIARLRQCEAALQGVPAESWRDHDESECEARIGYDPDNGDLFPGQDCTCHVRAADEALAALAEEVTP